MSMTFASIVHYASNGRYSFKSHHGKFLCAEPSGRLVADREAAQVRIL